MTDTLTPIHEELDSSLSAIIALINFDATVSEDELDRMVRDGDRRQRRRQERFDNPWGISLSSVYRSYADQLLLYSRWIGASLPEAKDGFVTFPVINRANTTPGSVIAYNPGLSLHQPKSDPEDFDNAGRHISDFSEPWHYEYPEQPREVSWIRWKLRRLRRWWVLR